MERSDELCTEHSGHDQLECSWNGAWPLKSARPSVTVCRRFVARSVARLLAVASPSLRVLFSPLRSPHHSSAAGTVAAAASPTVARQTSSCCAVTLCLSPFTRAAHIDDRAALASTAHMSAPNAGAMATANMDEVVRALAMTQADDTPAEQRRAASQVRQQQRGNKATDEQEEAAISAAQRSRASRQRRQQSRLRRGCARLLLWCVCRPRPPQPHPPSLPHLGDA